MSEMIQKALVFIETIPEAALMALLAVFVLLLVLLIAHRKKRERTAPTPSPEPVVKTRSPSSYKFPEKIPGETSPPDTASTVESVAPALSQVDEATPPTVVEPEKSLRPDVTVIATPDRDIKSGTVDEEIVAPSIPDIGETEPEIAAAADIPAPPPPPVTDVTVEKPVGLFSRLKAGLTKTRRFLNTDIEALFKGRQKIDEDLLEDLEELLITADIGVNTAMDLIEGIADRSQEIEDSTQLIRILKKEIQALLQSQQRPKSNALDSVDCPHVIMVVGVNGVGKTTTIGKLAAHYNSENKRVLIAAADTFRAAAVEQVKIWADRAQADLVCHRDGLDPAAVAFDGVEAGIARKCDVVIIDTAGRLHTKTNLMEELKKIKRSVNKKLERAPHEILLVLDATTGQNAVNQAQIFDEALNITGITLTKLDGTAKGGIVVSIAKSLQVPLQYIGVGEHIDDLQPFNPEKFVEALF